MESAAQIAKERTYKIISCEKSILTMSKEQDYKRCLDVNANIPAEKMDAKPLGSNNQNMIRASELRLDFLHDKNKKFTRKLKFCKLFDTYTIRLYDISTKNKKILEFCALSFPDTVDVLYTSPLFNTKPDRSAYFKLLIRSSYKVMRKLFLNRFTLNICQLKRLMAAYKHLNILGLSSCRLPIPNVPDLSKALTNCKIDALSLEHSIFSNINNCENSLDGFKNLTQGLAGSSDLRSSLEIVLIKGCRIKLTEAKEIFEDNQLGGVKIHDGLEDHDEIRRPRRVRRPLRARRPRDIRRL
ncbi:unnamed protein product [Moneuplotes crassus]|uniref:Uncharacterized protein n=1 Tax=Euplotes crassus TaxID=5936 RepID=A0AAD1UKB2_EUPCR|nr:unnamed protein product [Moneuplotes crassus]